MRLFLVDVMEAEESEEYVGFCMSCGEKAYGVEPDATEYECEICGEKSVYGTAEILLRGWYL